MREWTIPRLYARDSKTHLCRQVPILFQQNAFCEIIIYLYFNVFQHLESEVGNIGPRCKTPCPSLSYGHFCRLLWHCNQSECDNIKGCVTSKILVF